MDNKPLEVSAVISADTLERIADALERLVIAADQITTALQLQALKAAPTQETLDELIHRHERITRRPDGQ